MTEASNKIGSSKRTKIVSLQTDLKSLRYKDYSNGTEPLVSKDINKASGDKNKEGWYRMYAQGTLTEVTNRADDVKRITKWVKTPRGVLWEARQAALENLQMNLEAKRRNVEQPQDSKSSLGGILKKVGDTIVSSARLTADTLAQVAASETGYRVETFLPRAYLAAGSNQSTLSQILSTFKVSQNAQYSGAQQVLGGQRVVVDNDGWDSNTSFSMRRRYKTSPSESVYGSAGYVVAQRHEIDKNVKDTGRNLTSPVTVRKPSNRYSEDIRYFTEHSERGLFTSESNYGSEKTVEVSKKITGDYYTPGVGLQFNPTASVGNEYSKDNPYYSDVQEVEKALGNREVLGERNPGEDNLVPFKFGTYDAIGRSEFFDFEATLENFSDNYSGNWDETHYVGRAEKFYVYNGFVRQMDFKFIAVAKHPAELKPLYRKLNWLASTTAPNYSEGQYFMQGVLAEITIGDYLQKQKGFFTSVGLTWTPDYMWETRTGTVRVPIALEVSVNFTPIHEFNVKHRKDWYFGMTEKEKAEMGTISNWRVTDVQPESEKTDYLSRQYVDNTDRSAVDRLGRGSSQKSTGWVQPTLEMPSIETPSYRGTTFRQTPNGEIVEVDADGKIINGVSYE